MTADENAVALWVGCYTPDMGGSGEGILALARGGDGGYEPLGPATPAASPSFLALHPSQPVLYAVSEGAELVHAFRIGEGGALTALGEAGVASALVCHVSVGAEGDLLVVSCWGDGSVFAFELEPDGSLGRGHVGAASHDPYDEDRQSRAHSCLMLGDGRLLTADMGHDLARLWCFSPERGLEPRGQVTLPHGSGPRHFARRADGVVYVNTEHSLEIGVLVPSTAGTGLELLGMFPVSATGVQADDAAAEICLDSAERHLYVGVRGSNRICKLGLNAEGIPEPLAEFDCGGDWPRHHCFDGDRLLVALERSNALASFSPGPDGGPAQPPRLLATGSPTCLLPAH